MYCRQCSKLINHALNYFEFESCNSGFSKHIWIYDYADIAEIICLAKYKGQFRHFSHQAELLARAISTSFDIAELKPIVTFVPTLDSHKQQRGIDHANYLSLAVSRLLKLKQQHLLIPTHFQSQAKSNRTLRLNNPHFVGLNRLDGNRVLLIDDVASTRSTLLHASKALMNSGAKQVYCATLAYRAVR